MARETYIYKEEDWVPQNVMGVANRSNVYTPVVYYENGGQLLTDERRYNFGQTNKTEYYKYRKEQQMAKFLASQGFTVEHLNEIPGIPSPDIRINGVLADLKRLGSHNNIKRHADDAIGRQGADLVVFQFNKWNERMKTEVEKLTKRGIHGYYFLTDELKLKTF